MSHLLAVQISLPKYYALSNLFLAQKLLFFNQMPFFATLQGQLNHYYSLPVYKNCHESGWLPSTIPDQSVY